MIEQGPLDLANWDSMGIEGLHCSFSLLWFYFLFILGFSILFKVNFLNFE